MIQVDFSNDDYLKETAKLAKMVFDLNAAFHDAVNSPKGVVPKSGEQFYNQNYKFNNKEDYNKLL